VGDATKSGGAVEPSAVGFSIVFGRGTLVGDATIALRKHGRFGGEYAVDPKLFPFNFTFEVGSDGEPVVAAQVFAHLVE